MSDIERWWVDSSDVTIRHDNLKPRKWCMPQTARRMVEVVPRSQLRGAVGVLAEALAVLTDPERPDRAARNRAVAILEALDAPTTGGQ
jgi:hypothetical protein